jgi:hypothetical protein
MKFSRFILISHLQEYVANLLKTAFGHLSDNQIKVTVTGMFNLNQDVNAFKEHLRDFLVQIRVRIIFTNLRTKLKIFMIAIMTTIDSLFCRSILVQTIPTCTWKNVKRPSSRQNRRSDRFSFRCPES